ncbi:MAG TPA: hypothetical protein VMS25_03575, partial [Candidatus Limnocylindrales bacterium]|nr:hypothetical protein [Candidatus Limnocylindrales bacterium]
MLQTYNPKTPNYARVHQTMNAKLRLTSLLAFLMIPISAIPTRVLAFCHELDVVQSGILRVAASSAPALMLEWM